MLLSNVRWQKFHWILRCTFNPFSFLQRQFYLQSNFKVVQCVNSRVMLHGHKVTILKFKISQLPKGHLSTSATMFYLLMRHQILTWRYLIGRRRWHQLAVGTFATKPSLGLNPQVRSRKGGLAIYYKPPQATMTHFNDRGMQQKSAKEKRAIQSWHSPLDQIGSLVQIAANESSNNFLRTWLCAENRK